MKNKLSTKVIAVLTIALFLFSSIPMAEAGMSDKQKKQAWWALGGGLAALGVMRMKTGKPLVGTSIWPQKTTIYKGPVMGRTIGVGLGVLAGNLYAKKYNLKGNARTNAMLLGALGGGTAGYLLGKIPSYLKKKEIVKKEVIRIEKEKEIEFEKAAVMVKAEMKRRHAEEKTAQKNGPQKSIDASKGVGEIKKVTILKVGKNGVVDMANKTNIVDVKILLGLHGHSSNIFKGWGSKNTDMLKDFQKEQGLSPTGTVDEKTLKALLSKPKKK